MEEKQGAPRVHSLMMENRNRLSITGVVDVDTFDETKIILFTEDETMEIEGEDLHINKLNVDNGELMIEGDILSIIYTGRDQKGKKGLWGRMFK